MCGLFGVSVPVKIRRRLVPDSRLEGRGFNLWQGQLENLFPQSSLSVLTLIGCLFHPVLSQWRVKVSSNSAENAGCRLPPNVHTLLTLG